MEIPEEIQIKIDERRKQIREKADKIKWMATTRHYCPTCGSYLVEKNRIYCSVECSINFYHIHDYRRNSPLLNEYKKELMNEYEKSHVEKGRLTKKESD